MKKTVKLLIGLALVSGTLFTSCKKDTTWNTDWVLPLVNDKMDLSKLVNDSTLGTSGGYYILDLKRDLYNFSLTDIVSIPDTTIDRTSSLNVTSLNVPAGFEFYNSIEEHTLNLQDLELKQIILNGGFLDFTLENPVSNGIYITIELPGVSKNGQMLSETFYIGAGSIPNPSVIQQTINLSQYKIDLTGVNANSYNKLQSRVKIKSDPNGSSTTVTSAHQFRIKAKFRDVRLDYARGYFGSRILQESTNFNIDFLQKITAGAIDFPNTSIKLILENGIKIDGSGVITHLKNSRIGGSTVFLTGGIIGSNFTIDAPSGNHATLTPTRKEILFNSSNSNIEQFLENLGSQNEIGYKIHINPWGNTSAGWNEVFPQSRLKLRVEAQMPLALKMDGLTIRDTFKLEIDQKKDKTHIQNGTLSLNIDNAFPLQGKLRLYFIAEDGTIIEAITNAQPIESSLYGSMNENGLMHKISNIEVALNQSVIDNLNVIKHVVVEGVFDTPMGVGLSNAQVQIPVDAYIGIKAKANFKLKMVI